MTRACAGLTAFAVPSEEPSSTTMISNSTPRFFSAACRSAITGPMASASLYAGTTTLTVSALMGLSYYFASAASTSRASRARDFDPNWRLSTVPSRPMR